MAAGRIRSETFSTVDAAWLHIDTPTNMAMITGVMMFDGPLDFDRVKATIECRLLPFTRFRQRVKEPLLRLGMPRWEIDPHFDLDAHLGRIRLPAPGDQAALEKLAGELMSTPLDFSRPLWHMNLVDHYGSGSAMVVRLHHCIADGLALVQVLLSLTDKEPDAPWPQPVEAIEQRSNLLSSILKPVANVVGGTFKITGTLLDAGMETLVHPSRIFDAALLGGSGTLALSKLLLVDPDPKTVFKGNCGVPKRTVWSAPLKLGQVKAVGKAMESTLNDVVLTAVVGALRRYMEYRGESAKGVNIRAMVPVNLRSPDDLEKLGNRFGLVLLSLPVGIEDPLRRLRVLKRRMDEIKETPEAVVAFGILNAIGATPVQIEKVLTNFFASKATAVMTNVPGPREVLYLAGTPLRGMMFWVPQPAQLGIGVSILSYAGEVIIGVATDAGLVPDPETIIEGFHAEFRQMKQWTRPGKPVRRPSVKTPRAAKTTPGPDKRTRKRKQPVER